jgi:hypothetical protein
MSSHACKDTKKLLKLLVKQGCRINQRGQQATIYAPDGVNKYTFHMSDRGRSYHPIRRWAKRLGLDTK